MDLLPGPNNAAKISDVNKVVTALNALEARVAALEGRATALESWRKTIESWQQAVDKGVADHWALREEITQRRTANRLGELEEFAQETRELADFNRRALRVIFTVFHPVPAPEVADSDEAARTRLQQIHDAVHEHLDMLGGRWPLVGQDEIRERA